MIHRIKTYTEPLFGSIALSSSKSESNRALIISALGANAELRNLSDARDTQTMQRLLSQKARTWDVLDAGTTMRFCTALLSVLGNGNIITGSERMQQRPIKLLVEALIKIGAEISYLKNDGYPPLKIERITDQKVNFIEIPGNISSQYISALLMIAPILPHGLKLKLTGEIFSRPYIEMTRGLMQHFGVHSEWDDDNEISIQPQSYQTGKYTVESDWSGASYWYSMVALQPKSKLLLKGLREDSFQGDQEIATIMEKLGVTTEFIPEGAEIIYKGKPEKEINLDFRTCPDLAQTVMVTAALLNTKLNMTGLESLRIKETDRVTAMSKELAKLGATLEEKQGEWTMTPGKLPDQIIPIDTYEDHRMAMAFAPVAMIKDVSINDPDVVKKSYPGFWEHMRGIGIQIAFG
jgi:3-phosphoshikimate 1-carboxyvinyltransferase